MNKKGFTIYGFVILITVFAFLSIIAMPSILEKRSERNLKNFENEVEIIKTKIAEYNSNRLDEQISHIISSTAENQIDVKNKDIQYYADLNIDGSIKYLEISDGKYYYQYADNMKDSGQIVDIAEENPNSKLKFIKENITNEKLIIYKNTYDIYDETNSIPIVLSNLTSQTIKTKISYGNAVISEFEIPSKTEDYMHIVKLTKNMVDSMKLNEEYNLIIDTQTNIGKDLNNEDIIVKYTYAKKIKIKRVNSQIIITNVKADKNNDKIAFNQSGIFIPSKTDINFLEVKAKNNNKTNNYKFTNINRYELTTKEKNSNEKIYNKINISGEELLKYQSFLNKGKYIISQKTLDFKMDFEQKNNIQKISFDFEEYINPGIYQNGNIALSTKENLKETKFGDFIVQKFDIADKYYKTKYCSKEECFGSEKFTWGENGEINLGLNQAIGALNISQSMSIDDTYSVYTTIKADINQKSSNYPSTILALTQGKEKYLTWIGIYEGYLQVYSYYNGNIKSEQRNDETTDGFASIKIDETSELMNIQVTARRGGNTNVYINGKLIKTFKSGIDKVEYDTATIGDLKPSRGLKFTGQMYDIALYNTELNLQNILHNYNYAKTKWNIK